MPVKKDITKLESDWLTSYTEIEARRDSDKRVVNKRQINRFKKEPSKAATLGAYLTKDILDRRQELTLSGAQKLVFDFGTRGGKNHRLESFSLSELNKMAADIQKREERFSANVSGVPIKQLLSKADRKDTQRAKDIKAATLYKIQGNVLTFMVTASGESHGAPSHYQVKVRLENWRSATQMEGQKYMNKALHAIHGNVSVDCNCGRYLYWYRYLATIGNFSISPENIFPKIRNPKLTGCVCKHVLRVCSTLSSPVVQQRIAKEMQQQAQSHKATNDEEKYLRQEQLKRMHEAGSKNAAEALRDFKKAAKAFQEKQKQPATKAAKDKLKKDSEAQMRKLQEENKVARAAAKQLLDEKKALENQAREYERGKLVNGLKFMQTMGGMTDDGFKKLSDINNVSVDVLRGIAKEEGLL